MPTNWPRDLKAKLEVAIFYNRNLWDDDDESLDKMAVRCAIEASCHAVNFRVPAVPSRARVRAAIEHSVPVSAALH